MALLFWTIDSNLFWTSGGDALLFWRNPVSTDLTISYENSGPTSQSLIAPWENTSPQRSQSLIAPWENRGVVSTDLSDEWESRQGISQSDLTPYGYLQGITNLLLSGYESLQIIPVSLVVSYENKGRLTTSLAAPYGYLQGVSLSLLTSWESQQLIQIPLIVSYESASIISMALAFPYEIFGPLTEYVTIPKPAGIRAIRFVLQSNTRIFQSPVNKSIQTVQLPGAQWLGTYRYPPMKRSDAAQVIAFLRNLEGRVGRFYAGDISAIAPLGAGGNPWVDGAGQTGKELNTRNWTPSITNILKAGDYFAFDTPTKWRELHQVTEDVSSDGSGNATLKITPALRESPADGAIVILSSPTCVMMLADDGQGGWDVDDASIYGIVFSAMEVFPSG